MSEPPQHSDQADARAPRTCWWHPDRRTGLRCARCERPACPDCLREATVGYQCVDCVAAARKQHQAQRARYRKSGFGYRTIAGARVPSRPLVTYTLIALNVVVFVITAAQAQDVMRNFQSEVMNLGVLVPLVAATGEWWRVITSGFLHIGLLHLAVNMFALWILGKELERVLGTARYLVLYLLSLLGGSVAVFAFSSPNTPVAGASGAVYGVLGGILIAVLRLRLNLTPIIAIIVLNLAISIGVKQISLFGHLGGLVVGVLVCAAMVYAPSRHRTGWQAGAVAIILAALIGAYAIRYAQLSALVWY
ncbi:Membrane associated serine protease, rhomboid family [Haloechinothrix alba]|uniref:Membrane associated serine protease, rhomboid family n=1 Tax=Haloechinothrix alba TaxID=664784 RepID=A0A238V1P4_9PSEU|nr:rhomboid family intramembrane serine protease [Haloechinothrix alba]SNR28081.1 Membrane associated serine protease, rhomboid family [Haloechinothrix alba]